MPRAHPKKQPPPPKRPAPGQVDRAPTWLTIARLLAGLLALAGLFFMAFAGFLLASGANAANKQAVLGIYSLPFTALTTLVLLGRWRISLLLFALPLGSIAVCVDGLMRLP